MPWTKIEEGKWAGRYRSPSGKVYTLRQIRAYYATDGWKRPPRQVQKNRPKRRSGKVHH